MDIFTVIGLAGFAAYVTSYGLLQLGRIDGNGLPYTVANIAAASMVLMSMVEQFNLASALIQVTWISLGVVGIAVRYRRPRAAEVELDLVPVSAH